MKSAPFLARLTVSAIGLTLVAGLAFTPTPTYAVFGVGDTTVVIGDTSITHLLDLAKNTLTSVSSNITSYATNSLNLKEYVLDGVANAVAKAAIQSLVHSVVNWANSGFNGSPAFATNLQVQLGQISDQAATKFLSQLTGTSLGSPFQAQVVAGVQSNYFKTTASNAFQLLNKCTLGTTVSAVGSAGFDFTKGGLSGWFKFATQPQNNPIGLSLAVADELNAKAGAAVTQAKSEVSQNGGFFSWRGNNCTVQGIPVSGIAGQTVAGSGTGAATIPASGVAGQTVAPNPSGSVPASGVAGQQIEDNGTNAQDCDVVTPGSAILAAVNKATGSSVDSLVSADEINEVVTALAQGLITNVLGGGGLAGVSKPQGGGSDYFTQTAAAADAATATAGIVSNLSSTITQEQAQVTQYQTEWQTIGTAANTAQSAVTAAANNPIACTFGEGSSASDVLQNVVNPVVAQATAAAAKAATSLQTLTNIQTQITTVNGVAPTTDAVTNAGLNYQQYLTAATTPSDTDVANAQTQSQDISGATGVSTTPPAGSTTLLTEMNNITKEATACPAAPILPAVPATH